jgi:hypothetical protein
MKSSRSGKLASAGERPAAEILQVSPHGIWLAVGGEEFLLTYADHPWFRGATIDDIFALEFRHGVHLHWPKLDVDLHLDSLRDPERFPLRAAPRPRGGGAGRRRATSG